MVRNAELIGEKMAAVKTAGVHFVYHLASLINLALNEI